MHVNVSYVHVYSNCIRGRTTALPVAPTLIGESFFTNDGLSGRVGISLPGVGACAWSSLTIHRSRLAEIADNIVLDLSPLQITYHHAIISFIKLLIFISSLDNVTLPRGDLELMLTDTHSVLDRYKSRKCGWIFRSEKTGTDHLSRSNQIYVYAITFQ